MANLQAVLSSTSVLVTYGKKKKKKRKKKEKGHIMHLLYRFCGGFGQH